MIGRDGHTEYFPGTSDAVPALLTDEEACRFLRLDLDRDMALALKALARLVYKRRLNPARIGRPNRYTRTELLRFIDKETREAES